MLRDHNLDLQPNAHQEGPFQLELLENSVVTTDQRTVSEFKKGGLYRLVFDTTVVILDENNEAGAVHVKMGTVLGLSTEEFHHQRGEGDTQTI